VKAPFDVGDGRTEYLWLAVGAWEGDRIDGVLRSRPSWITTLRQGDRVTVRQGAIFDYLLRRADGTSEGNETERFLR